MEAVDSTASEITHIFTAKHHHHKQNREKQANLQELPRKPQLNLNDE